MILAAAALLFASPIFPAEVQTHLSLGSAPQCTLCHQTLAGGLGTVTRPFGMTLMARGCQAGDLVSLDNALDAMAGEPTDSDGDGVGDIAELQAGTNPNGGEGPEPEYGCFGRIGPARPPALGASVVALAIASLVRRRRR